MFETNLESTELVKSITFPIKDNSFYIKLASQASKYAIIGIFGSILKNTISLSVTGAANKVFLLDEFSQLTAEEIINFNFNNLDLSKYNINSDIHASSCYRASLIKNMLPQLIKNVLCHE